MIFRASETFDENDAMVQNTMKYLFWKHFNFCFEVKL